MKKQEAFTLIELLVVIAIIGIVASMVVGMAQTAKRKQHDAQVNGMKQKLILLIADYQSKLNFYPPDNGNLTQYSTPGYYAQYDGWASTNPLIYELTGATNNSGGSIFVFDGTTVASGTYPNVYVRNGVANANTDEPHSFYFPRTNEYSYYAGTGSLAGFIVPVPLMPTGANYWHYDASSTNRHNLSSYDLWAEYSIGSKGGTNIIVTNGNW